MTAQNAIAAPPKRKKALAITIFTVAILAMFVAVAILNVVVTGTLGPEYLWVMTVMGAVIITALLAGVFVPYVQGKGH